MATETNRGPIAAETFVVATGIWSTPFYPAFAGMADFRGRILHGRDYKNPAPFAGQRVLVVGAGNTGSEIAVELSAAGVAAGIVVRSGAAFGPYPRSALRARGGLVLAYRACGREQRAAAARAP
jgi:cation diffusion facilitator CzcD-associated flavoprotein CzcO